MTAALPLQHSGNRAAPADPSPRWHGFIAPGVFGSLVLALFHDVLFQTGPLVLSGRSEDLAMQFLPWRDFGFTQMRQGNLPLWNPYIFGGAPYFAGFQSALLYPPNWLHLILPLATAVNWIIALHVFLAGYFLYLWCRGRGAGIGGSVLGGIMFMFSGPYFLHIYAGHLPHLCLMVWVPLQLLAIEKLADTGSLQWCLLGIPAVAMMILAGHPQYVYYTGLITFLYMCLLLIRSPHRGALGGGYLIIFVGASLIAAVQLLAGAQAAGESIRSGGTDFRFASTFAFPPENFLTLIAPDFFGTVPMTGDPAGAIAYFGRCYLWEMSLFVSVSGLALAVYGAVVGRRKHAWIIILVLITAVLALGRHLPTYRPLFDYLPFFGSFRSVSKFSFLMTLFICALAASGFDFLIAKDRGASAIWTAAGVTGAAALLMLALNVQVARSSHWGSGSDWGRFLNLIAASEESYQPGSLYSDERFIEASAVVAANSARWAALALGATCAIFIAAKFWHFAAYGLIGFAVIEMFVFARHSRETMVISSDYPSQWREAIRSAPGDFRVLNGALHGGDEFPFLDQGMSLGIQNLWGYDPGVMKRYAETIAVSQGYNPDAANQNLQFHTGTAGLLQMLRCRFALLMQNGLPAVSYLGNPLSVAQLVPKWVLRPTRDEALSTVMNPQFNPRQTVVLESSPAILPSPLATGGPVEIIAHSTDWLELRAQTTAPCLLLITNNYSTGWRAVPLEKGPQQDYEVQPANYTLMAIPLAAGIHHLRIEYLPTAFRVGKWISIVALPIYIACAAAWLMRCWRKRRN